MIGNLNSVLRTITSRGNELARLITTLQQLVSGLAADRQSIGSAISAIASLTSATAGLLQVGRPPLQPDITQLRRLAANLAANSATVNTFLQNLPLKMADIARLASYGSWLNFFLCDADGDRRAQRTGGRRPPAFPSRRRGARREVADAVVRKPLSERNPIAVAFAGLAILAAIALLTYLLRQPADHRRRHRLHRLFRRGGGLQSGNEVAVAGVTVGQVTGVVAGRRQGRGDVPGEGRLGGQPTTAAIEIKTLLGDKYLALDPLGTASAEPRPADTAVAAPRRLTTCTQAFSGLGQQTRPDQHCASWPAACRHCPTRSPPPRPTCALP